MRRLAVILVAALGTLLAFPAMPAIAQGDVLVSNGSPPTTFAQNKQNEPAIAVDERHPTILAAGANEEIDIEACNAGDDTTCPFTPGIGTSGIYFSTDGGSTWTQPTYTGLTARGCLGVVGNADPPCSPAVGPIGTVPKYYENGLVSDGDPALAFGPVPGEDGSFSWDNGSRLYYANLTASLGAKRKESPFKGVEGIGVSRTDDAAAAAANHKSAWQPPVVVQASLSNAAFADKEQIWADNASSSDFFGNVYLCFANYKGGPSAGSNAHTLVVARSTDGGDSWTRQILVKNTSSSSGQPFYLISGASGCTVRTASNGEVYVFWAGFNQQTQTEGIYMAKSTNGGQSYTTPRRLFTTEHTGVFDPALGRSVMDGIAGARSDLSNAPSADIANGAPYGGDATDEIVLTWVDGKFGLNHEPVMFTTSTDGGATWSAPEKVNGSGTPTNRGYYSAPAISPDGTDVYLVYNKWLEPYKDSTLGPTNDRPLAGVVLHGEVAGNGSVTFTQVHESTPGDARGSSQNDQVGEFLGDYVYAVATRDYGAAVWNDVRDAADCPAEDAWRMSLRTGASVPRPAPKNDCPPTFGNSDIYGARIADPTP
jgi:hypothetical protein